MLLPGAVMQQLFKPVLDQVLALVRSELNKVLTAGGSCERLLLVGGFANSPALVQHLRRGVSWCGVGLSVPIHASAAVVKGELTSLTRHCTTVAVLEAVSHCCLHVCAASYLESLIALKATTTHLDEFANDNLIIRAAIAGSASSLT